MRYSEVYILELVRLGFFSIDSDGRIWKNEKFTRIGRRVPITPVIADKPRCRDGYLEVRAGRKHIALSHRIVFAHFNGPIPEGKEINHLDGIKHNNRPTNLVPVTPGENDCHAYRVLGKKPMKGENNGNTRLTWKQVEDIRRRNAAGESARALGRDFGVSHTAIRFILRQKLWKEDPR